MRNRSHQNASKESSASASPWSSPVVMVKRKDRTWRFCFDYRKLNAVTHQDTYPLPRIDETLDLLTRSTFFYLMELAGLRGEHCLVYLGDAIVFSETFQEHF